jgi:AcrR family transcriptional regulator
VTAATATAARPGRPSSGARERILAAALAILKADGYAGLTTAKVAAAAGENKALIAYHFGSKQGLVAAVAREVSEEITREVLEGLGEPGSVAELVRGLTAGIWRIVQRDEGLARVYFDLASQSIVEPEVQNIMRGMKAGFRGVLAELMSELDDGPPARRRTAAAVYLVAGVEGLALEWLERGQTPELRQARTMFERSAPAAIAPGR